MKRTIKTLLIVICCFVSCNIIANAGNDKPIAVNALPVKAQSLLNNDFKNQKVMLATIESGVVKRAMMWFWKMEPRLSSTRKEILQRLIARKLLCLHDLFHNPSKTI